MFEPKFSISNQIANALTSIERARGFLEAASLSETWLTKMQNKALVAEAYHTTHIEGTQLTLDQSKQLWEGKKVAQTDPNDVKELLNYRKAFDLVADYVKEGAPITEILVREIHKQLVNDVRGNSAAPGLYRKIQNYVVNSKTQEVVYTPPPVYEVASSMQELVDWLNQENEIHAVLVAGIAQFQLVHIHPFLDGNGRTARLLSTLCLYKLGYDFKRLFSISEYYDRNRPDYYQALQSVRENDMDLTYWLEYFTKGLADQLNEVKDLGKQAIEQDVMALQHGLTDRQKLAIEFMAEKGKMSITDFEKLCPVVTRRTLQRELKGLINAGVVSVNGATNNLMYTMMVISN
jgi:Fic family protein